MRKSCNWFTERASLTWNAKPGRSILILIPHGCDETAASQLIRGWTEDNFVPPEPFQKATPFCITLTTDSMVSCEHFARTFAKRFIRLLKLEIESDPEDYPTDVIQSVVEAVLATGFYPIVAIDRFHAFALINDPGMTSVLSGMRTLENSGQLTTLSFSPLTYSMIRRLMQPGVPFLNSVYGDNHDEIVMTPLTRAEFVEYAISRGITANKSNALYPKGGGPDAIYESLAECSHVPENMIIEACLNKTENTIENFLTKSFNGNGDTDRNLIAKLAVGKLLPQETSYILSHPLHRFLVKETADGNFVCSSQIIARKILRGDQPRWKVYGLCLDALANSEFEAAADIIFNAGDSDARLIVFKDVVLLRASMQPKHGVGLLGIDWPTVAQITKRILDSGHRLYGYIAEWVTHCQTMANTVITHAMGVLNRLQLDALTLSSSDSETRRLTLNILGNYLKLTPELDSPSQKILHLVNIPEAILQAISSGFCEINFIKFENKFPHAPYDDFFAQTDSFKLPPEGSKLTLTALLVIIPAVLSFKSRSECGFLTNKTVIKSLQAKLVDCVRNPASHTIVAFVEKDADFLYDLCQLWIDSWAKMEGYVSFESFSSAHAQPSTNEISALVLD